MGAGVPGVEEREDLLLFMAGLFDDADADADAATGLAKSLAPTDLVLVTLPSSMRHLSLRPLAVVDEGVGFAVAASSVSGSLPPRIRLVDVSKSR